MEDVQRDILERMEPLPVVALELNDALGLVLAEAVMAPHDVPQFANSAMDGFALRAGDVREVPVTLEIIEDVPAGHLPSETVRSGSATKIMTGAPLPSGADAVVQVEDTAPVGEKRVRVERSVSPGAAVRPAGGDLAAGSLVFPAGERLSPTHLGVLATIGYAKPRVRRRPRIAVFSTGDELRTPETSELPAGAIRDANRPILLAMLADLGVETIDMGIVEDDVDALRAALARALVDSDGIVSSGGVSMGDHDVVKEVLRQLGGIDFWKVAMKPGKPLAFGIVDGTPLFGLPGNPVSVVVAFEQFVRPMLLHRMGATRPFRPRFGGILTETIHTNSAKTAFIRVTTDYEGGVWLVRQSGVQGSNVMSAMARADAFAVIPVGVGTLEAGSAVDLEMFRWPEDRTAEDALGSLA